MQAKGILYCVTLRNKQYYGYNYVHAVRYHMTQVVLFVSDKILTKKKLSL